MVSEEIQTRVTKKICVTCNREFTGGVSACPQDGTVLIPLTQDPLVGTKLADRYLVQSVVGYGGMGIVYKARHELMDRDVAIKMLKADLKSDQLSVKRFQQEARAACRLKHPNVITLFDFGVSPSAQPYLVMDYLKGISLADVIKKDGHVGVDRTIKIFLQAARALEHAHRNDVIHRDLKPGNIMLEEKDDEKDFVKVVDFGVAKILGGSEDAEAQRLTQTGEVCGSPVYMSPEQCMGQKLDPRSDIYSMGVVMYETLTGRLPLLGKTMVDTMQKHTIEQPPPFGDVRPDLYIPERLEAVVFKALKKDPGERQQSMAELERELEQAVPKPARSTTLRTTIQPGDAIKLPNRAQQRPKSKVFPAKAAAAVLVGLVSLMTLAFAIFRKGDHPDAHARTAPLSPPPQAVNEKGQAAQPKPDAPTNKTAPKSGAERTSVELHHKQTGEAKTSTQAKPGLPTMQPKAKKASVKREPKAPLAHSQAAVKSPAKTKMDDPFASLAKSRSYKPD